MNALMPLEERLERALHEMDEVLDNAAETKARVEEMEERRKQTLSTMVVHYRTEGMGVGEAEHQARASKPYKDASEDWIAANYAFRRADAQATKKQLRFDAWRSRMALEREQMKLR